MTVTAGTRLGPYEILSPLGAGGMGEVWRARDTKLDREVAVKVLPAALAVDPAALARFEREAKAVAALSHPNILAVHDFGESGGTHYAVMELLEGEALRQRLSEGPLAPRKAAEIAREVALGLAAAHEKGIVHRDLKPENLFLTRDGRVKILDFGLARQLALPSAGDTHSPTAALATEPGTVLGTVGYMAPEQLRGQPADHRSDIFSLGAVLYELLSGDRAFRGESAIETMNAILKDDPPELSESSRPIPPGLERIVSHCLEKRPEERFQSARDLAFALSSLSTSASPSGALRALPRGSSWPRRAALGVATALALGLALWAGRRIFPSGGVRPAIFRRLTFRRGNLFSARFAPDGQTIVYGAAWEGRPGELFSVRTDSNESRPLSLDHTDVLSVSSKGDLAVKLAKGSFLVSGVGLLARVPLGGGAPRELLEDVYCAAWAPDGENLAVIRKTAEGKGSVEYPIGHPLYESLTIDGRMIAISPQGDQVAFAEWSADSRATIFIADREGRKRALTGDWPQYSGLAWSRPTGEIFFIAGKTASDSALRAVSPSGRERIVWPAGGRFNLLDAAPDGRLLLERFTTRRGIIWVAPGQTQEKELGWLDSSALQDLSPDGSAILFTETGDAADPRGDVFLRRTDGSAALRLGDGRPMSLTPDGKWALALGSGQPPELVLLPTGPGSSRKIPVEGTAPLGALVLGDGKRVAVFHSAPGKPPLLSVVSFDGGRLKAIPIPGVTASGGAAFSPDGTFVAYTTTDRKITIAPVEGGASLSPPGPPLEPDESLSGWTGDGRFLLVQTTTAVPARIFRIDIGTGQKTLWKEIQPADRSGITGIRRVLFTRDGSGYAYSYSRIESSDLYLVEGLK